ncbi:MAG TPA: cation-transporting P-type ATPase [Candidatus Wunengus sp. YC61]
MPNELSFKRHPQIAQILWRGFTDYFVLFLCVISVICGFKCLFIG